MICQCNNSFKFTDLCVSLPLKPLYFQNLHLLLVPKTAVLTDNLTNVIILVKENLQSVDKKECVRVFTSIKPDKLQQAITQDQKTLLHINEQNSRQDIIFISFHFRITYNFSHQYLSATKICAFLSLMMMTSLSSTYLRYAMRLQI